MQNVGSAESVEIKLNLLGLVLIEEGKLSVNNIKASFELMVQPRDKHTPISVPQSSLMRHFFIILKH